MISCRKVFFCCILLFISVLNTWQMFIGRERKRDMYQISSSGCKMFLRWAFAWGLRQKKGLRRSVCLWESLFPFFRALTQSKWKKIGMKELGTLDIGRLKKHFQKNAPNSSATNFCSHIFFISKWGVVVSHMYQCFAEMKKGRRN